MSGWNVPLLSELAFGLFIMIMGAIQLLPASTTSALVDRRAGTLKLRYGDGGVDLPAGQALPRWPGFVMIALGASHVFWPRPSRSDWALMLVMGTLALGIALLNLLFGARYNIRRQRRYEAELDRLADRRDIYSDETYSQELRALQANRPTFVSPQRNRLTTGLFIVFGTAFLALGLIGARQ